MSDEDSRVSAKGPEPKPKPQTESQPTNPSHPPAPAPAPAPIPAPASITTSKSFSPLVTVVGFHHARGPEVESWFGAEEGSDPAVDYGWTLLPFMALSDGAHA